MLRNHNFMKSLFLVSFLILIFSLTVNARAKYQNIAQKGGKLIKTSVSTSYKLNETYPSCTVTVYRAGTTTLANIYSNNSGSIKANPFTSDSVTANYFFYADNGRYDVKLSGTGIASPFTIGDIILSDLTEPYNVINFGAVCNGATDTFTSITATVNAIVATGKPGKLILPQGLPCVVSSMTIPALVIIDYTQGGSWSIINGNVLTIVGSELGLELRQKTYFNTGTVSFAGNKTKHTFYPENWGASPDSSASVNNSSLATMNLAMLTYNPSGYGNGIVEFGGGNYSISATWLIGSITGGGGGLGEFSGISIKGSNGLVGTKINYLGATNLPAIYFTRGRNNHIDDLLIESGVAKGTSIGLLISGPAVSMQTTGPTLNNVTIRNFHIGFQLGGGSVSNASVDGITFIGCTGSQNDIGLFTTGNGNTLNIDLTNSSFNSNSTWGVQLGGGSGAISLKGGAIQGNGINLNLSTGDISLSLAWNLTVHLENIRFEPGSVSDGFNGGIVNLGGWGEVNLENLIWNSGTVPNYALLRGVGYWTANSLEVGGDAQDGWILFDADNNGGGAFSIYNSRIQNTNIRTIPGGGDDSVIFGIHINPASSGAGGMSITAKDIFYTSGGIVTKLDKIDGIIGLTTAGTPKIYANKRVNSFGQESSDTYDWTDQDATPSAKWAKIFKTNDSAGIVQTNIIDGVENQTITILCTNGNRTIQDNANQQLAGNANFVCSSNDIIVLKKIGSVWIEVSRSVN